MSNPAWDFHAAIRRHIQKTHGTSDPLITSINWTKGGIEVAWCIMKPLPMLQVDGTYKPYVLESKLVLQTSDLSA